MAGFKDIDEVEAYAKELLHREYRIEANGKVHWLTPSKIGYRFKFDNAKQAYELLVSNIVITSNY